MRLVNQVIEFLLDEQGASATEYAVVILLILLVALAAIAVLGTQVGRAFDRFVVALGAAASR